tara:strand:+ start:632 stop:925 length:294 start_codon:yes stop_codon:yes gene_type:complete
MTTDRENAYKLDRGFRSARAGAAIGFVLGALVSMLLSRWIPENFFWPIVVITAAIFAVAFGLFIPGELSSREFDSEPDNITPAERVKRLHSGAKRPD